MQPVFQKIDANLNHSFHVNRLKFPYFPNPLQFHPEMEILYVIHGTGTRFVGDSISRFGPGDLILVGQNVPHLSYSDEKYRQGDPNLFSEVIFLTFDPDIFGEKFWQMPESLNVYKLIQLSQRGIILTGKTREEICSLMVTLNNSHGFRRIALLLTILDLIATRKDYKFLGSTYDHNLTEESDSDRLSKVYDFVIRNYDQEISLEKAAGIANLSVPAFCRYFKKRVNKTFIQLLNEVRISHACRIITQEDQSVSNIGYNCGYTNVSYFIRQFKRITGYTPLNYKKKYSD